MYDLSSKCMYIRSDKSLLYDKFCLDRIHDGLEVYEINNDCEIGIIEHH